MYCRLIPFLGDLVLYCSWIVNKRYLARFVNNANGTINLPIDSQILSDSLAY